MNVTAVAKAYMSGHWEAEQLFIIGEMKLFRSMAFPQFSLSRITGPDQSHTASTLLLNSVKFPKLPSMSTVVEPTVYSFTLRLAPIMVARCPPEEKPEMAMKVVSIFRDSALPLR